MSRKGQPIRHMYCLAHRFREQARSHRFCGWLYVFVVAQITVGAELARDGVGTSERQSNLTHRHRASTVVTIPQQRRPAG